MAGQEREAAEAARWIEPEDGVLLALWWLECVGELSRYEIAAALQWPVEHTAVVVASLRARLDAARVAVGAVSANPLCPALGYEAGTWDGRPCAAWRERLARHAGGCAQCSARWRGLVPLEALLAGLPLVPPPTPLLAGVRESAAWALAATAATPQATTRTPDAYETPEPHGEPWQYATEGRADWSDQNHDTDRYDHIASVDLTRPFPRACRRRRPRCSAPRVQPPGRLCPVRAEHGTPTVAAARSGSATGAGSSSPRAWRSWRSPAGPSTWAAVAGETAMSSK